MTSLLTPRRVSSTLVFAAAASQMGATNCGEITRDPGFDLWCGDTLCAWKVERGNVARVPTWNEGDPGVSLLGSDTAIEQLTPVDNTDGSCIQFDLIANIATDAQVSLNVDIDGDGTLEQMEQLPTSNWKPLSYVIAVTPPYSGIRFELAKRGGGEAVLAQISAKIVDGSLCASIAPLDPGLQLAGEPCGSGGDCASGLCAGSPFPLPYGTGLINFDGTCEGCDPTAPSCGSGQVCGAAAPTSPVRAVGLGCVADRSAPLGAQCAGDLECASGVCETQVCSACRPGGGGCGSGEACAPAWLGSDGIPFGPDVCAPGAGKGSAGQGCAQDSDCASAACVGAPRRQCSDGRACAANVDCPFGTGSNGALANGACVTVGVQGGSCQ